MTIVCFKHKEYALDIRNKEQCTNKLTQHQEPKPQRRPRFGSLRLHGNNADHIRAPRPRHVDVVFVCWPMFAIIKCHYSYSTSLLFSSMTVSLFSPLAVLKLCASRRIIVKMGYDQVLRNFYGPASPTKSRSV